MVTVAQGAFAVAVADTAVAGTVSGPAMQTQYERVSVMVVL